MPNLAHAMWIHGVQMQVENPGAFSSVTPTGWGMQVDGREGQGSSVHFAIPTPVIIDDQNLRIGSVMLQFTTASEGAVVRHVSINDGGHQVAHYANVNLSGPVGWRRFDVPAHPQARLGVVICVYVEFIGAALDHRMTFEAAGCDFLP